LTTDFRDLLGEVLSRELGTKDLGAVFPGHAGGPGRFPGVLRA
jgi:CDP-diglyceride synthetase